VELLVFDVYAGGMNRIGVEASILIMISTTWSL
jgi:hypothetical protein